jgi:hypothetical protein
MRRGAILSYTYQELAELKSAPVAMPIYSAAAKLERKGKDWIGKCPFSEHKDDSPSFTITEKDGVLLFHCFGCGKSGNVLQFIQELSGCLFSEAVAKVAGQVGWKSGGQKVQKVFQQIPSETKKYEVYNLADLALAERSLASSPLALTFLESRAISLETAKKHHLGFIQSAEKVSPDHELVDQGWILIPTVVQDKVTCLKYRSVTSKAFVRKANMETSLYNADTIQAFDDIHIVEGEFDAMVLEQAGFRAVALPGAQYNLSDRERDMLVRANRIFLAGDMDVPGRQVMHKLWNEFRDRTYLMKWPEAKDANEFLLKTGANFAEQVEVLKAQALEQPMPYMHDLTETLAQSNDTTPMDNPARLRMPWPTIDAWCPILPGDVMVVSATETGTGKTSWLMDILLENSINYGKIVLNYSAEVSPADYARRAAAYLTGVAKDKLGSKDYEMAASKMGDAKFYNGYNPHAGWREVIELLKWAKRRLGADIIVIDHLHFITRSEKDEIKSQSEAMRAFKDFAIEYGVVMIVVGQPRKPKDEHFGRELQMRGIKGSESLASDASQVFILHRKRISDEGDDNSVFSSETKVILDKSRESEGRVTKLLFRGEICKFVEMANIGVEE